MREREIEIGKTYRLNGGNWFKVLSKHAGQAYGLIMSPNKRNGEHRYIAYEELKKDATIR